MRDPAVRPRPNRHLLPALAALLLVPAALPLDGCRGDRAAPAPGNAPAPAPVPPDGRTQVADVGPPPAAASRDVPATPTIPTEPHTDSATPPPPSPALAAHLARVPEGPGPQLVVRVELPGLAGRAELRAVARHLLDLLETTAGPDAGADAPAAADTACLVELLGSVSAVTYVWQESAGPDAGLALIDAAIGLPLMLPCLHGLGLPVPADADTTGDGLLELAPEISAAAVGDGTFAVGATALVRAAQAGAPARPLSRSAAFDEARAPVGTASAWAALFEPDGSTPTASTVHGGIGLRTESRLGLTGVLTFADPARAGALVARATELLAGFHQAGRAVLQEAARRTPEQDLAPLRAVLDAARDTRFVVDAGTLSFETWLPPGFTVPQLLGALIALEPILDLL